MRLNIGDLIRVGSRKGEITEIGRYKNGERVYSYGIWWCYRSQIDEVYRNGEWIKFIA